MVRGGGRSAGRTVDLQFVSWALALVVCLMATWQGYSMQQAAASAEVQASVNAAQGLPFRTSIELLQIALSYANIAQPPTAATRTRFVWYWCSVSLA